MSTLASLDAPNIQDSRTAKPGEAHKRAELAKFLSDLHLVAFLGTTQLFSIVSASPYRFSIPPGTRIIAQDDMKVLIRTVSSPTLLEDLAQLDAVLATEGWQTLMTFTRESARAYPLLCLLVELHADIPSVAARPSTSAPGGSSRMDEDIPQDVFDQIAAEEAARSGGSGAGSGGAGGIRICPHCTFENDHGGTDCEVCGLPL